MNTVFVSGILRTQAQIEMNGKDYLLTFDMMNHDQSIDPKGTIKQILTPWAVSLRFDKKPTQLLNRLAKGIKVMVKGAAKINYKEVGQQIKLECELAGQQLEIFEGHAAIENQYTSSKEQDWTEHAAIAS